MSAIRGRVVTLLASTTVTTSGNSGTLSLPSLIGGEPDAVMFILPVTAVSTGTTLDVYFQWSPDTGTTWYDFLHSQPATTAAATHAAVWSRRDNDGTGGSPDIATGDGVLAAGKSLNGPISSNYFRIKYVVAGSSYTFSVLACLDRD